MAEYAAHIDANGRIHALEAHLQKVAARAGDHAGDFGREWAALAGKWHDLGKYSAAFQKMIFEANGMEAHIEVEGAPGPRNHSTAGAIHAVEKLGAAGRVLAYLIAGHHAGLPNWDKVEAPGASLRERLAERGMLEDALKAEIPENILAGALPALPDAGFDKPQGFALWVRMLFSALVDADFLDTEHFYDPDRAASRGGWKPLGELKQRFVAHMQALTDKAEDTPVNRLRARVLADCRRVGREQAPGFFSLTVPTGCGKTLSSMAFALEHALRHGKRRIIHVIPYTSIIEQTAEVFRNIFGGQVVEHHSSLDPDRENHRSRLAAENWDAPIIVTTSVQFFESLFAARTSRCRKLHNISDSLVILDEAQLLPPSFLQPILDAMKLLAAHYGVSFVLSTATQPALSGVCRDAFGHTVFEGLDNVREIVSDPDALYEALARVRVEMPEDVHAPVSWEWLAEELAKHESVLAIVDSRKDARELFRLMPEGTIHLSALMCGEHRSQVIADIKRRLRDGVPTRVVSTQLVEAGVDLDFPVVYRALAGLDSIAQAAGRCNREGKLKEKGRVVVFVPPRPPYGLMRHAQQKTISMMSEVRSDPLAREHFTRFFSLFYRDQELDKKGLGNLLHAEADLSGVQFRTAALRMRMIEDEGRTVFVRFDETSERLLEELHHAGPSRERMRRLQRYSVSVRTWVFEKLLAREDIEPVWGEMHALVSPALYDQKLGLLLDGDALDAGSMIV